MTGRWFSPDTPVSSINQTDRHDITEILLKVALSTLTLTHLPQVLKFPIDESFISPFLITVSADFLPY
jgi:hypothetical protein